MVLKLSQALLGLPGQDKSTGQLAASPTTSAQKGQYLSDETESSFTVYSQFHHHKWREIPKNRSFVLV